TSSFSSIRICMTVLLTKRGRLALSRHALLFHGLEDVRDGVVSVRELVSASRALVITRFPRAPTVFPVVRGAVAFAVNVAHRSDRSCASHRSQQGKHSHSPPSSGSASATATSLPHRAQVTVSPSPRKSASIAFTSSIAAVLLIRFRNRSISRRSCSAIEKFVSPTQNKGP